MARGILLKTKVKEVKALVKAEIKAKQEAEASKDWKVSLREHIGKMIDRVDPLEVVAVLSLTPLVKSIIIDPVNGFLTKLGKFSTEISDEWEYAFSSFAAFFDFSYSGLEAWMKKQGKEPEKSIGWPDWMMWIIAFGVAFLIVRYAGLILSAGTQTLTSLVTMFMPLVLA